MFPWLLLLPFSLKKLVLPKLHKTFAVRLRRFFWDLSFHFHSIESVKKHVHVRLSKGKSLGKHLTETVQFLQLILTNKLQTLAKFSLRFLKVQLFLQSKIK